jgi:hypothetical protein
MGEVIAIPLASERRAATVLAALRRLAAGHQTGRPEAASGGASTWPEPGCGGCD